MIREGQAVLYTGTPTQALQMGDQGRALSVSGHAVHVQWATGASSGSTTLHYDHDLVRLGAAYTVTADLDDSLDVGGLTFFSARRTFDEGGEAGVLNAMANSGHLASFQAIAEEAIGLIESRIRNDASFRAISADLEDDEAESVVRLASIVLVRDAFGGESDG